MKWDILPNIEKCLWVSGFKKPRIWKGGSTRKNINVAVVRAHEATIPITSYRDTSSRTKPWYSLLNPVRGTCSKQDVECTFRLGVCFEKAYRIIWIAGYSAKGSRFWETTGYNREALCVFLEEEKGQVMNQASFTSSTEEWNQLSRGRRDSKIDNAVWGGLICGASIKGEKM